MVRRRTTLIVAGIVVVVAIVAAFVLLGGDVPLIDQGPSGPGEFAFRLSGVRAAPTSATPPADLQGRASEAGDAVKATMDELYLRAFVDTESWGDYEAAFAMFDEAAAERAQADAAVLTLGPDAQQVYESMGPARGQLRIVVLTDRRDTPVSAVAKVSFTADAERTNGATTEIKSSGSFFLRKVDGEWRIFAYRVDRDDETAAAPSPTGSPS
jgi:hypothetical protein